MNTYYGILPEIDLILTSSQQEETKNTSYEGIALLLRSYVFSILTDNWGNIPFSEAIRELRIILHPNMIHKKQSILHY
ncbi:SusD/RagB family nutrient-binding outer membrane lipoprotein [Aquimarina hainanensis]|uniref:SusD/RagB family nutrient-binding outer membrane lipoprotein n=1 Tax=Aquimarina hainanensis TaxID=1578017 RepID=UPI003619761D